MSDVEREKSRGKKSRFRFIVGVSLVALEEDLNQIVSAEPYLDLNQVLFVPGTGFVAVVERSFCADDLLPSVDEIVEEKPIARKKTAPSAKHAVKRSKH